DDRARRDAAVQDLAGLAVEDPRALADVHPHREHAVFLDDDAFDHLRAGADEAVVLDDHGIGLDRLQHATDSDTPGKMHVLPDLGARTDCRPGVDHRAFVHI